MFNTVAAQGGVDVATDASDTCTMVIYCTTHENGGVAASIAQFKSECAAAPQINQTADTSSH